MTRRVARANTDLTSHIILMVISFLYVFVNLMVPKLHLVSIALVVGLFIFYSYKRIINILITAIIVAIVVGLLPFLAPIAFIIMVIIFFFRIKYIIQNWKAVLTGFYMYGVGAYFALADNGYFFLFEGFFLAILMAGIVTFIFHILMTWLYNSGYSLEEALPIMGVTPLLIMLLFLPFVKSFDSFEGVTDSSVDTVEIADVAHHGGADVVHHGGTEVAHHGEMVTAQHGNTAQGDVVSTETPGVHHTHSYYRTGPDGTPQFVRGYTATNPDGVLENNFSYKGEVVTDTINTTSTGTTTSVVVPPLEHISSDTILHSYEGADSGGEEVKRRKKTTVNTEGV